VVEGGAGVRPRPPRAGHGSGILEEAKLSKYADPLALFETPATVPSRTDWIRTVLVLPVSVWTPVPSTLSWSEP
jgi:hypothetical protein